MAGSTISTTITIGITLGSAAYPSPLTITGTGNIAPVSNGATAVTGSTDAQYVLNEGQIAGGAGVAYPIGLGRAGGVGGTGVSLQIGTDSVTNSGTIAGGAGGHGENGYFVPGGDGGQGGTGINVAAGTLINSGLIAGGAGGDGGVNYSTDHLRGGNGGAGGIGVALGLGSIFNDGKIVGGTNGYKHYGYVPVIAGTGVDIGTGTLTNHGTIIGGAVVGYATAGAGVVFHAGGTLIDTGSIGGGAASNYPAADAVSFGTGNARLVLYPGADIGGHVVASASYNNTLELAAAVAIGTLSGGIGAQYLGFNNIVVDAGASWVLTTGNTLGTDGAFTVEGSLTNRGGVTGGSGNLFQRAGGSGVNLSGGSLTNDGTIDAGAGGGGPSFGGGAGGTGVEQLAGSLTNNGAIAGGDGGAGGLSKSGGSNGGSGGDGAFVVGGNVTNQGTVTGGNGGPPNGSGSQGSGGIGVAFQHGGTLGNTGFIGGGIGPVGTADAVYFGRGSSRLILGPSGQFSGAIVANETFSNVLELASGSGTGAVSGIGSRYQGFDLITVDSGASWVLNGLNTIAANASLAIDGSFANDGTIVGITGTTASAGFGGDGGAGVNVVAGILTNNGTVDGGRGGAGYYGGNGAIGVRLSGGSLANDGTVIGGAGARGGGTSSYGYGGNGGIGVYVSAGRLTNLGTIIGGSAGTAGLHGKAGTAAIAIRFAYGGTLIDSGLIAGGNLGAGVHANAVYFGSSASRLVLEPGAGFLGSVVAQPAFSNMVELSTGASVGTLSGGMGAEYQGFATITVDAGADWVLTAAASGESIIVGGRLTNQSTITGSSGGAGIGAHDGSQGGAGVDVASGSLANAGTITGATGGTGGSSAVAGNGGVGGSGVDVAGGGLANTGVIAGGVGGIGGSGALGGNGGAGGAGVFLTSGYLANSGTIVGGAGGATSASGGYTGAGGVGVLFSGGGTLTDAGFIGGGSGTAGIADAVYFGNGPARLILDSSASFDGAVIAHGTGSNVLELRSGSGAGTITGLGSSVTGFGTIRTDPGAYWFIAGNSAGMAAGQTFSGLGFGDVLELTGFAATGDIFSADGLVLSDSGGSETLGIHGAFTTANFSVRGSGGNTFVQILCFARGTNIRTSRGDVPVERLRVGEVVPASSGDGRFVPKPITWIGKRTVSCWSHPEPGSVWPVRIRAGAFGDGVPQRDLFLSPDHAVFVQHVLIPIKYLINGTSIAPMQMDAVTYFHVELPQHSVLLAEGLPVESYLDAGNRAAFENGDGVIMLHPDFGSRAWEVGGCAPLVVTGPRLEALRKRINAVARRLPVGGVWRLHQQSGSGSA